MKSQLENTQKSVHAINNKQVEIEGKINLFARVGRKYQGNERWKAPMVPPGD